MSDVEDARFERFRTDPKFRRAPKRIKKVQIDKRFKDIFTDKRFSNKVQIDKRGRPLKTTSKDDYERYYNLEKDEEDESSSASSSEEEGEDEGPEAASDVDEEALTEKQKSRRERAHNRIQAMKVDYARGEGVILTDSSSSEESSEDEYDSEEDVTKEGFDRWGELDNDAERTEEATRRIAVCNMDWDRVKAEDIFLALSSFCPKYGRVVSVYVYISDFGKKRLEEEDRLGPEELRRRDEAEFDDMQSSDSESDSEEKINAKAMERARKYQINKLRYYYAVAEFDTPATANKVYEECDGAEYELSASRFDLRFIPDDMSFSEDEAASKCTAPPDPDKYEAKQFCTTALQLGKVELTWDETDPERTLAMQRAFDAEDENSKGLAAYINMESSGESEPDEDAAPAKFKVPKIGGESDEEEDDAEEEENTESAIAKYKALLSEIGSKEQQKRDEEGNMEITFKLSDKESEPEHEEDVSKMTPWEMYLHKKKQKSKAKREERKKNRKLKRAAEDEESADGDNKALFSDDDVPSDVDFDDDFFKRDEDEQPAARKAKKSKKNKKAKADANADNDENEEKDLGLLVMDSDDDDGHFDYKEIVKNETKSGKKKLRRKQKKQQKVVEGDDFEIDVQDDRFGAIFKNANFHVDPSHPSFKKTKAMQKIIEEKQKRVRKMAKK